MNILQAPTSARALQAHITATYFTLRLGLAALAGFLPPYLWLRGSWWHGLPLKESMSAYYFSDARNVFVAVLCAVGALLYLYKGFSIRENVALNCAGILIVCVALIPTDPPGVNGGLVTVHGASAVFFFLFIAYVCIARSGDTIDLFRAAKGNAAADRLRQTYRVIGWMMALSPLVAYGMNLIARLDAFVFFAELVGVWVFAAFWCLKSYELAQTQAEGKVMDREVEVKSDGKLLAPAMYRPALETAGVLVS